MMPRYANHFGFVKAEGNLRVSLRHQLELDWKKRKRERNEFSGACAQSSSRLTMIVNVPWRFLRPAALLCLNQKLVSQRIVDRPPFAQVGEPLQVSARLTFGCGHYSVGVFSKSSLFKLILLSFFPSFYLHFDSPVRHVPMHAYKRARFVPLSLVLCFHWSLQIHRRGHIRIYVCFEIFDTVREPIFIALYAPAYGRSWSSVAIIGVKLM